MTTSENDKENESTEKKNDTGEDRLEEIKKEEKEDASSYYAQGKQEAPDVKKEFEEPVPPVDNSKEDLNLLRAVAFLGFGLAALAIIFILFFIRDLDHKVGGVDSAVNKLEGTIGPFKEAIDGRVKAVEDSLQAVSQTVSGLQGKLGSYEKTMAIMELKRALVMIQGISMGSNSGVQSKSSEVAASIQSLLNELGGGDAPSGEPAGVIQVEEAVEEPAPPAEEEPVAAEPEEAPAEEEATEEAAEETDEAKDEAAAEEEATEETAEDADESGEESAAEDADEAGDEHAADESDEEEHAGDENTAGLEELPTIEELLQESE